MSLLERLWRKLDEMFKGKEGMDRSLALGTAIDAAIYNLSQIGEDAWIVDVYLSGTQVIVLLNITGKLYTAPIIENADGTVTFGAQSEVVIDAQSTSRMAVSRQIDGRYRWFAMSATAVINKAGEIDSRAVFDDMIDRWERNDKPNIPLVDLSDGFNLRFFHEKTLQIGVGDWLARDENILLASGLIDDSELGRAFIEANKVGRGDWGTSIGFWPLEKEEILRTSDGIEVPVYRKGWLEEISVLPVKDACSFFTRIVANVKERTMAIEDRKRIALIDLMGDEAKANEIIGAFLGQSDETNRAIADGGLLTRETTTEQTEATTTEQATETPPETAIIPGEPLDMPATSESVLTRLCTLEERANEVLVQHHRRMDALELAQEQRAAPTTEDVDALKTEMSALRAKVDDMSSRMDAMEGTSQATKQARETDVMTFTTQATTLGELKSQLVAMAASIDALKLTDEEKQRTWLADRPANSATQPVTYRPREERRSDPAGTRPSFADIAAGTLASMPKQNR